MSSTLWDDCRNYGLWMNLGSGSSSTVETDAVLELLEKTVVLGNIIRELHMKEGKMFHWASQGTPYHKWLQCLKNRQHS